MQQKDEKVIKSVQTLMERQLHGITALTVCLADVTKEQSLSIEQMLSVKGEIEDFIAILLARLTSGTHYEEIHKAFGNMDEYSRVFTDILSQLLEQDEEDTEDNLSDIPF